MDLPATTFRSKAQVSCGMQRRFTKFVEQPTRENYLAVRDAILRQAPLKLMTTELAELSLLLDEGDFQTVLDRIDALPPSKALSPRIHFLAAEAAELLGDTQAGEVERFLFVLCLKALLSTGRGSESEPYVVCHAADEYDVLEALGLEPAGQELIESDGRVCDLLTCSDGREVWFDVTALFRPSGAKKNAAKTPAATARQVPRKAKRRPVSVSRTRR